jgi:hypothetical protein
MKKSKVPLLIALAALFIAQGLVHSSYVLPKWQKDFNPNKSEGSAAGLLNPDQLLFALVGLREFIAGILWVRADSFFDSGQYDAILPIIKLVTWLDPKQIDVYATGMWHIGYNFTDEESRSDRRYLKPAIALGKQGAAANPDTYELFFETGWLWHHKIDDDHFQAVKWFEEAHKRPDILPARRNLLGRAYERNGQLDKTLDLFVTLRKEAIAKLNAQGKTPIYQDQTNFDTIEQNLDNLLVRMSQRGYFAILRKDGSYETGSYDSKPPHDVGFSARVTVPEPNVLQVDGTYNVLPIGSRIRIVLRDADYDPQKYAELDWDGAQSVDIEPERDKTIMQDGLFVKNGRFSKRIDMSKDVTMYPFRSKNYIVEFYYNPRSAPEHMKDKFGFNGEGFTDKNFLNTTIRPGARVLYTKLELTRDEIKHEGEWIDRVAVKKTFNYKSMGDTKQEDEIVIIPSVRAGENKK